MGWLIRGGERITSSVHKNSIDSRLESKFVHNTTSSPFPASLQHPPSSPASMSILFERQESDMLVDSCSSEDSRNAPVCSYFKFSGNTVPELFSCPASSQLHSLLEKFYPEAPRSKMSLCLLISICPGEDIVSENTGNS